MTLAFTRLGPPPAQTRQTVLLAHGILGSRRNWHLFARQLMAGRLERRRPDVALLLVDLRGHGDSQHLPPPHTLTACAMDLARLLDAQATAAVVAAGHSFGAKVVLELARLLPGRVRCAWLLDGPLGADTAGLGQTTEHAPIRAVVQALSEIPMPGASRDLPLDVLRDMGYGDRMIGWMSTNLQRTTDGFVWRFDLPTVRALLGDWATRDLWPTLDDAGSDLRVSAVIGGQSDHLGARERGRLEALAARGRLDLTVLPTSGHWLHADDPDGLQAWMDARL